MFSVIQLSAQTNCMATCFCTDQRVSCIMIALKVTFLQVVPVHLLSSQIPFSFSQAIHPNLASRYFKMRGGRSHFTGIPKGSIVDCCVHCVLVVCRVRQFWKDMFALLAVLIQGNECLLQRLCHPI